MVGEEAELHKKLKGNIAELATATELAKLGLAVFRELGDNSRVDLITIVEGRCIKIQVKWAKVEPEGCVFLYTVKTGPNNYRYKYTLEDIDVFALYVEDTSEVLFISAKEAVLSKSTMSIRYIPSKNNQRAGVRMAEDYRSFLKSIQQVDFSYYMRL